MNGLDAVQLAKEKGWKPGTIIMSPKSWVTEREVVSIESWCIRLKEVGASKTSEEGAVYKTLPKDVVEIAPKPPEKRLPLRPRPGYVYVELSHTAEEMRYVASLLK